MFLGGQFFGISCVVSKATLGKSEGKHGKTWENTFLCPRGSLRGEPGRYGEVVFPSGCVLKGGGGKEFYVRATTRGGGFNPSFSIMGTPNPRFTR